MEIVIGLIVVAGVVYYLFRKYNEVEPELQAAPYKTEAPVVNSQPAEVKVEPALTISDQITDSVTQAPPSKKPRRQYHRPSQKQVEAKKAPAIQAQPKAKKPRAPKAK